MNHDGELVDIVNATSGKGASGDLVARLEDIFGALAHVRQYLSFTQEKESTPRHCRLLRASGKRPCGHRAGE